MPPEIRKAVLVVHGMGNHPKSTSLKRIVTPLIRWMYSRSSAEQVITNEFREAGKGASSITVEQDGYVIKFAEVLWAESFDSPPLSFIVKWILLRGFRQFYKLLQLAAIQIIAPTASIILFAVSVATFVATVITFFIAVFIRNSIAVYKDFKKEDSQYYRWAMAPHESWNYTCRVFNLGWEKVRCLINNFKSDDSALFCGKNGKLFSLPLTHAFVMLHLIYQFFNSLFIIVFYVAITIMFIPILLLVFVFSTFASIPGSPKILIALNRLLDKFLAASIGDLLVFLDDPVQAEQARSEVYKVYKELFEEGYKDFYVLAHSTGGTVAYETLTLDKYHEFAAKVKKLITVGSTMNLTWNFEHRESLGKPLGMPWINYWARYDPILPGPIDCSREGDITNIPVTNEDDPLNDHTSYWDNYSQVIPGILSDICDEAASPFYRDRDDVLKGTIKRKILILSLAGSKLLFFWYPLLAASVLFLPHKDWAFKSLEKLQITELPYLDKLGNCADFSHSLVAIGTVAVFGFMVHRIFRLWWGDLPKLSSHTQSFSLWRWLRTIPYWIRHLRIFGFILGA